MQVFISYAREDYETARKLYDDLRQQDGIKPWMDEEDILIGRKWMDEIDQAIRESDYFLVLLSSNSVSKEGFVQEEMRMALERIRRLSPDKIFILPLLLDECKPKYKELENIHWGKLYPCYEDGLKRLLRSLPKGKTRRKKPEPPPKAEIRPEPDPPTAAEKKQADMNPPSPKPEPSPPKAEKKQAKEDTPPKIRLRSEPRKLSEGDVKAMLAKFNFFDSGWHKSGNFKNDFRDNGDRTVSDRVTGLMWQKSGSEDRIYHKDRQAYIEKLNQEKFAGYDDWRLPTIEELASLLENEERNGDLYIDPVFGKEQRWCWSADERDSGSAWSVDFNVGSVNWNIVDNDLYVRAVRS